MNLPSITPGQNGYLDALPQQNYTNPWAGVGEQDQAYATAQQGQSQQNMNNMQQTYNNYAGQTAPYPTFPNSAGLGSQNAYAQPQPEISPMITPSLGGSQNTDSNLNTNTSLRGANPWSLSGEANARD